MEEIVYKVGNSLYINATNKCTNNCVFCVRTYKNDIYGDLWLDREPTVDEVLFELKKFDLNKFKEVVFCGFGEPTYRLDVIEKISEYVHSKGKPTRINTNGHGSKINGRDISQIMVDNIDTIGISLNEVTPEAYQEICKSVYKEDGFTIMIDFAKACVKKGGHVVFSVVDSIGPEKIAGAKEIAKEVGADLRIRELIKEDGSNR